MAKTSRATQSKTPKKKPAAARSNQAAAGSTQTRTATVEAIAAEPTRAGWATDLVFDVREPKLAVSLRLDADVLRFFRDFGSGYQTRINAVLKAFMQARGGAETAEHAGVTARAGRRSAGNGKRASS